MFSQAGVVVSEDCIRVAFDGSLVFGDVIALKYEKKEFRVLTRNDKYIKIPNLLGSDTKEFQHLTHFSISKILKENAFKPKDRRARNNPTHSDIF